MITGYNTDVRRAGVVYHVQTEDKGSGNPLLESLVYVGGQVVAARRSSYSHLLADGGGEAEVVRLMERQHRTVIAAIKAGRFDRKVIELMGDRAPAELLAAAEGEVADETIAESETEATVAGKRITSEAGGEPTLDQVILEYLTSEATQEQLQLTLHDGTEVTLGAPAQLALRTTSSRSGDAVSGAEVTVRMISTIDEPRSLARGVTDEEGGLELAFEVPALDRGTAALIITASSAIGRAEIKQLL